MRTRTAALVVAIICLASLASPVWAARMDPLTRFGGGIVADQTSVFAGFFSLTVESEVRFDGSVYTYFYGLSGNTGIDPVEAFNVSGSWAGSSLLDWGLITGETSAGVWLDPVPGDISFGTTMTANFADTAGGISGGLGGQESITLYVQSLSAPILVSSVAIDDLFATGQAYGPSAQVQEPSSLLLFGSGLIGLGLVFGRDLRLRRGLRT